MQGLILLDKPQGITSFGAVSAVKRTANEKRVGHTGTLDPMATGVLPVLLGKATALSSLMLDADKRYIARIKLGITTDTDDITGKIISQKEVKLNQSQLDSALAKFVGKTEQEPPMYSAIKKDGVRLYKLARNGEKIDIPARSIEIFEIKLTDVLENDEFVIETHVSKGTYIRSLARDIGEYLGCGATLTQLRRTYASGFEIGDCVDPAKLNCDNIGNYVMSEEMAVCHLRELAVTEKQAVRFGNGGQLAFERIQIKDMADGELFRVKFNNILIGIGISDYAKSEIAVKCVINKI